MEIKYLLGIDGGGTKTEFLLTGLDENEIKRLVLGASNPVNIGMENTKEILKAGITQICEGIDPARVSLFAGLAGGITGENKPEISRFLSEFGFGAFDNGSDTENALKIALGDENGVVVIIGTGIVAFAQKNGTRKRIGGWGYMVDQGGSGYRFGSDALDCAFKALDGRGGSDYILSLIENRLNKPLTDAVADIYSGGAAYVASFARDIFSAYEHGDIFADNIINKNAGEIAQMIRTGLEFAEGRVVLCGGLCRYGSLLEPFILRRLKKDINLSFCEEPSVNGSIKLAKDRI